MPTSWDDPANPLDDREYPDPDPCDDDSNETVVCPHCGADVYEEADQCPACRSFLIPDTRVWSDKSLWWIALGLLGIIAVVLALGLGL